MKRLTLMRIGSLQQTHHSGMAWWVSTLEKDSKRQADMRSDRTAGNRGAYEKARLKILKTQTICGICGKPVDFSLKYPHPLSPTVDHIIPVSKGGHPTDINNLQLAHRCCNREKSDKLMASQETSTAPKVISNRVLPLHADWQNYQCQ